MYTLCHVCQHLSVFFLMITILFHAVLICLVYFSFDNHYLPLYHNFYKDQMNNIFN